MASHIQSSRAPEIQWKYNSITVSHNRSIMTCRCTRCCLFAAYVLLIKKVNCNRARLVLRWVTVLSTPQSDNRALLFLDNNGLSWTVSAPDQVTAVPVIRNGNFQTPISVPEVRPKRCHTLSMMPLPGWPVMAPNAYDNNTEQSDWS